EMVPTEMVQLQVLWYRAVYQLEREAMREDDADTMDPELAVAVGAPEGPPPLPAAGADHVRVDLRPEPTEQRCHIWRAPARHEAGEDVTRYARLSNRSHALPPGGRDSYATSRALYPTHPRTVSGGGRRPQG